MGRRKVVTTVYFRPEQLTALSEAAERLGVTSAALVREGVDIVLRRYQDWSKLDWVDAARVGSGRGTGRAAEGA